MYEAQATGNMACSEDIAVVLARERRDNKEKGVSNKHLRVVVSTTMKEVSQGVSDLRVREYRGGTFGEDGRTTFVCLLPTNINVDVLASTDRKLRRCTRFSVGVENKRADAGRDGQACFASPNSETPTKTGKYIFSLLIGVHTLMPNLL